HRPDGQQGVAVSGGLGLLSRGLAVDGHDAVLRHADIAPIAVGEHQHLLRRALGIGPHQDAGAGTQIGQGDNVLRQVGRQLCGGGHGDRVIAARHMQHRGLLRNGGAGDLIVLGHGVVGGDVAHDQAGRGLGRQAQRHGGANPGIDGVPVLQRLQVQGVAGDGVQIGGIPHVDHHRVAQAVLLPAVQQEGVLIHPGDSAPIGRGAQAGGRFFVSGLRGRGGDRQHGGAEDQGQALQNPFFHSRSSFPMLSGEHLLRLPVLTQGSGKKFPSKAEFLTNIFEAPRRALYPSLRGPASRSGWFPPR
ncbi:DUF6017 domain-containing protein, partial [Dysosmobacter welbionis]